MCQILTCFSVIVCPPMIDLRLFPDVNQLLTRLVTNIHSPYKKLVATNIGVQLHSSVTKKKELLSSQAVSLCGCSRGPRGTCCR